ncbi:MAG: 50S ribosomal protein L1 [Chlamydiae bacterium]|nr:50S ribosomal protein L1 [Chlamydiota bacterium]
MAHVSKRMKEANKLHDKEKQYDIVEAIELLQKCPQVKFDQTLELSMKLGVDPKKADQLVRGTVSLPHGTGKKIKVLVIAKGDKAQEALDAGADYAGDEEYFKKIQGGWLDFDAVIATPDMMREIGKLARILGPRGLMPTPKAGTVTTDITKAVTEIKAGKIEYKVDKNSVINNGVGKLSFAKEKLEQNVRELIAAIVKAKPSASKGAYILGLNLASTMGPGCKINLREVAN